MSKAGGHARAAKLSPQRRKEIAQKAAVARWGARISSPIRQGFPWDVVKGWSVTSRADGSLLIEPDYINPYRGPEEGGGPGMFTRMALADWCLQRLTKRRSAKQHGEKL